MRRLISKHAQGIAMSLFALSLYIVAARWDDQPSTTDALQLSAQISNDLAAETVALKDTP